MSNVYGIITAPQGLRPVLYGLEKFLGKGQAYIYKSKFDTETLCFATDIADFESKNLEKGSQYLLNGTVTGTLAEIIEFVETLSDILAEVGVEHRFEIYDGHQFVLVAS